MILEDMERNAIGLVHVGLTVQVVFINVNATRNSPLDAARRMDSANANPVIPDQHVMKNADQDFLVQHVSKDALVQKVLIVIT